jgi:hypothetical protein
MYYENAEHTQWVFKDYDWHRGLIRVDYVMVKCDSNDYQSAVENSHIQFWADKQKQLMKDFKNYRIQQCVVCYETKHGCCMGVDCRTCKNAMCFKCSYEYSLANMDKFPYRRDPTDNIGCGVEVLLPCPMCRTDNLFMY